MSETPNQNRSGDVGQRDQQSFWPHPPQIWVDGLRNFLRDLPELNILLDGMFESTDEQLADAWGRALVDWNNTEPVIQAVTFRAHPAKYTLFQKAIAEALKSISVFHARNELSYSDGGVQYNINDKHRNFQPIIDRYEQQYEQQKVMIKSHINMDAAWGHVHTDFNRGAEFLGDI